MLLERIAVGVYAVNCYILSCENTKKTVIIDPGGDAEDLIKYLNKNELDLSFILLTHAHGDHIGGIPGIRNEKNVPVLVHEMDSEMLQNKAKNLSNLISGHPVEVVSERLLKNGDVIELGELKLEIIHTPGHTLGSISIKVDDMIFTGDTLFASSIGRTDLEGGSFEQIIKSIKEKLLVYEDNIHVLPGHGSSSTIGKERNTNPFLR